MFKRRPSSTLSAVVFDLDNTLVETETPWQRAWQQIFQSHNVPLTTRTWRRLMTTDVHPREHLYVNFGVVLSNYEVNTIRDSVMSEIRNSDLMPGARELLSDCKSAGLSVAIATNGSDQWVSEVLSSEVLNEFDVVVTRDNPNVRKLKPQPDLHHEVLRQLRIDASSGVAIEDSLRGIRAVKRARLAALLVPSAVDADISSFGVSTAKSLVGVTLEHLETVHSKSGLFLKPHELVLK